MTRRQYAGGAARTTITALIASSGGGTVTIASATGWPDGSVGKFHIVVDAGTSAEEKILVDSRVGTTLSFSGSGRGADDTVATSHSPGADIWCCVAAVDLDEANAHINQTTGSHTGTQISFSPTGNIAATNVQTALTELDAETDARLDILEAATVGTADLDDASVTTAKIADDAITAAKMATAILTSTSAQATVSGGSYLTWEAEASDPDSLLSFVTNVVTFAKEGLYIIGGKFSHSATLTGNASLASIEKNGANTKFAYGNVMVNAAGNGGTFGFWPTYFLAGETAKFIFQPNVNGNTSAITMHFTRISA